MSQRLSIKYNSFGVPDTFWIQTLLAGLAIICLPRQFHVAVVELRDEKHIRGARRWFAVYLVLTIIAIIPDCQLGAACNARLLSDPRCSGFVFTFKLWPRLVNPIGLFRRLLCLYGYAVGVFSGPVDHAQ